MAKKTTTKKTTAKKTTPRKAPAKKPAAKRTAAKKSAPRSTQAAKPKKLSALDAAAKVLSASRTPLSCKDLIQQMEAKGLWTSPGGKTPSATLYSAIIREIAKKGKDARFVKVERGRFASTPKSAKGATA